LLDAAKFGSLLIFSLVRWGDHRSQNVSDETFLYKESLEFVRRFHPLISTVVLRTTRNCGQLTPTLLDDLVQETYLKLVQIIAADIPGINPAALPSGQWNIRNFGWSPSGKGAQATVTRRTANETASVVTFINSEVVAKQPNQP